MAKVKVLEILTGSEHFGIEVEFQFRKLEYVCRVEYDLCAKFGVNRTWFVRFRHRLWKFNVSSPFSLNWRAIHNFSIV